MADDATGAFRAALGVIAARRGDRAEALRFDAALRDNPNRVRIYDRARIAALLGDREQAVALLREAYAHGREDPLDLHRESSFESLRDYAPLQQLMKPQG